MNRKSRSVEEMQMAPPRLSQQAGEGRGIAFNTIGLCQKNLSGQVEVQNEMCLRVCGWRIGQVCKDGCMKSPTVRKQKRVVVHGSVVQSLLLQSGDKLITILTENEVRSKPNDPKRECLSKAETKVLELTESGMSNKEIADYLCVTLSTIKSHINSIRRKIDAAAWRNATASNPARCAARRP